MKNFFLLLSLMVLVACATTYKEVDKKSEQIHAAVFNENKLYLVGELADYQFEGDDVLELQAFLQSPFVKQAKTDITRLAIYDQKAVKSTYEVSFNLPTLSEEQINQLQKEYGFGKSKTRLTRYYRVEGKPVQLANHQELRKKYAFAQPIRTEVRFNQSHSKIDNAAIEETSVRIIGTPGLIAGVVIFAPFAMLCTAINGCN